MHVSMAGMLIGFSGDWTRGLAIVERVSEVNPHHMGTVLNLFMWDHYRNKRYAQALDLAERMHMPSNPWQAAILAMTHGQLGHTEVAARHLKRYLELQPEALRDARGEWAKWFVEDEMVDHLVDGLRKAGLENAPAGD
jgi:hypothetical protein